MNLSKMVTLLLFNWALFNLLNYFGQPILVI